MLSIVISEKGGNEEAARYDQGEVTIGRVKGNDIMLPRGNVSKRHAKLMMRDGRYIVTDLKSTNGTYVNHRRITHATLVRAGDRIYIGDFVLRIDGGEEASLPSSREPFDANTRRPSRPPLTQMAHEGVSHFPIEHDPDPLAPMMSVPAPPRIPAGIRNTSTSNLGQDGPLTGEMLSTRHNSLEDSIGDPGSTLHAAVERWDSLLTQLVASVNAKIPLERLRGSVDDALRAQVESTLDSIIEPLRAENESVDFGALRTSAMLELCDLGPLTGKLNDSFVTRIAVVGKQVTVSRTDGGVPPHPTVFTSLDAARLCLDRLCLECGVPVGADAPSLVDRALETGSHLYLLQGDAAPSGAVAVITRSKRPPSSLNAMVRAGTMSRGIATFLKSIARGSANVLIVAPEGSGGEIVLTGLWDSLPTSSARLWLQLEPGHAPSGAVTLHLGDAARARRHLDVAGLAHASHLFSDESLDHMMADVLDVLSDGGTSLACVTKAASARRALHQLAVLLTQQRPSLSLTTALEVVHSSFDVVIETDRLRDGRCRVLQVLEPVAAGGTSSCRSIFRFAYHHTADGGSVEGSFQATGIVPRVVDRLALRGRRLDPAVFRRPTSR